MRTVTAVFVPVSVRMNDPAPVADTAVGVIAPSPIVNRGVVVVLVQVAVTPLLAAAVSTLVTVPPEPVADSVVPVMAKPLPRLIST